MGGVVTGWLFFAIKVHISQTDTKTSSREGGIGERGGVDTGRLFFAIKVHISQTDTKTSSREGGIGEGGWGGSYWAAFLCN